MTSRSAGSMEAEDEWFDHRGDTIANEVHDHHLEEINTQR